MTKQEAMFRLALMEEGFPPDGIRIDHVAGKCYQGDREYSVIFPQSWVDRMRPIRPFTYDVVFRGLRTPKRGWVENHKASPQNDIAFTELGRTLPKTAFDFYYYRMMCGAKFALCPDGDVPWTYRFFEACLCHAIPVTENGQAPEGYVAVKNFVDMPEYSVIDAENNYRIAVTQHTIKGGLR